jgi:dolichol-phosphate mannosyltransferase
MGEAVTTPIPSRPFPQLRISVVLPIYQTAQYLRELYSRLRQTLEPLNPNFEILMIEDGSRDQAWAIISELAAKDRRVMGIRFSRNFGQHPAIAAGFEQATGEIIVLMDADLQDRPEDIPKLIALLDDQVDVVYTTKIGEVEQWSTRITSAIYHYTFMKLTGTRVPRNIGTFRVFTRRFLNSVLQYPERNVLYGPLMFHVGFQSKIVAVVHESRDQGRSSYSFRRRLRLAVDSILSYTEIPQRLLINIGGLITVASALYAVAIVVRWLFTRGGNPPGVALIALLITLTLGILMFSLGIIGLYVFRVFQEVLARPRYLIARSINMTDRKGEHGIESH